MWSSYRYKSLINDFKIPGSIDPYRLNASQAIWGGGGGGGGRILSKTTSLEVLIISLRVKNQCCPSSRGLGDTMILPKSKLPVSGLKIVCYALGGKGFHY